MEPVKGYLAAKIEDGFPIDGDLSKSVWANLPWSEDFQDILGGDAPKPWFRTRMKMAYSGTTLYIAAELEEPHVWGTLTQHDSVIFHDNDFEVFLDPDGDQHMYAELELNVLNTTWDLLLVRPYRAGGPPVDGFELAGLRTAVKVLGTLNNSSDTDTGWTVEIAIPWASARQIAGRDCPPKEGDQWRINFSRVQWHHKLEDGRYVKIPGKPEENWVWSPQGVVDMHRPHRWGYVQFGGALRPLDRESEIQELAEVWEAQRAYREKEGRYALCWSELGLTKAWRLEATPWQFRVAADHLAIDHEARISKL